MKKLFVEFIVLAVYMNCGRAFDSLISKDYYSVDEDVSNPIEVSHDRFLCPPPFPDLLEIFQPSLHKSPRLDNITRNFVKKLLEKDCETFSPLFNSFLSDFNSNLCPFHEDHTPILQTNEIIENAVASTCRHSDLSDEEWGRREEDLDGDWKNKRAGRKDYSEYNSHLSSIQAAEDHADNIVYKAVYNEGKKNGEGGQGSAQDPVVAGIQRVGSIILVVVFVSVLVSVLVVVGVLAWVRNNPTRSFVDVQTNAEDAAGSNHWYDATANKQSYLMEERGRKQAVKQYL